MGMPWWQPISQCQLCPPVFLILDWSPLCPPQVLVTGQCHASNFIRSVFLLYCLIADHREDDKRCLDKHKNNTKFSIEPISIQSSCQIVPYTVS